MEHNYGTTTFDAAPERIVSLDNQWTDVLVALDAPLVGAALDPTCRRRRATRGRTTSRRPSSRIERRRRHPATKQIAALQPDLIVVTYLATDQATYDQLARSRRRSRRSATRRSTRGRTSRRRPGGSWAKPTPRTRVADAEQLTAEVAAELPGLEGKTYALANYVPGDAIYVVADPDDGASAFFAQLGLEIDPDLGRDRRRASRSGRAEPRADRPPRRRPAGAAHQRRRHRGHPGLHRAARGPVRRGRRPRPRATVVGLNTPDPARHPVLARAGPSRPSRAAAAA